jgi:hypothetical protein
MQFLVYMYRPNMNSTRFIIGIFDSELEAKNKQIEFCGKSWKVSMNDSIMGINNSHRVITFVKTYKHGDVMEQP